MKTLLVAAIPAIIALGACSGETEAPVEEQAAFANDDNDAPDPDDDPPAPVEEEHADDHEHDGEDADHAH